MILRTWHGWTHPDDADAYDRLVTEEILPRIAREAGDDLLGWEVGRRRDGDRVEFVTLIRFASREAVGAMVDGDDLEEAHVPEEAQALLADWEERVRHHEVRQRVPPEDPA